MRMKARLVTTTDGDETYQSLYFWCPGCEVIGEDGERHNGMHCLPVSPTTKRPFWEFDGHLESPTLTPSILTRTSYYTGPDTPPREFVCHSFLKAGVFQFLSDCTHDLKDQFVPIPDLPEWWTG
jgi:hypothetical protein